MNDDRVREYYHDTEYTEEEEEAMRQYEQYIDDIHPMHKKCLSVEDIIEDLSRKSDEAIVGVTMRIDENGRMVSEPLRKKDLGITP